MCRHHPIFARCYRWALPAIDKAGLAERRRELLAGLSGRVLELGAGDGANFAWYPPSVEEVVAVEPEPFLRERAGEAATTAPVAVRLVAGRGEALPFADATFDAVVSTLVLCSVDDVAATLAEIRRVLVEYGELRLLEHVRAEGRILASVQRGLDRTVWPRLFGGCHTARKLDDALVEAGFLVDEVVADRLPRRGPRTPVSPQLVGIARVAPRSASDNDEQLLATAALDAVENMVLITDLDGTIVYVNRAFSLVTGYSRDEAIGATPRLLRSGMQDEAFYQDMWSKVLAGESWNGQLVNRRKNGELYTDRMTITPLRGADGQPVHFIAIKRDVSAHLAALTAGNPAGIAHLDRAGRMVYANARLSELFDRDFERLVGDGWTSALDRQAGAAVRTNIRTATAGSRWTTVVAGPRDRWLRLSGTPLVLDVDDAGVVLTVEDVTVERLAQQRLEEREAFVRAVVESLAAPTVVVDAAGKVRQVNAAWRSVSDSGREPEPIEELYLHVAQATLGLADAEMDRIGALLARVLSVSGVAERLDVCSAATPPQWWEVMASPLQASSGGAVITHSEVTWRHDAQRLLFEQARTDPLTGLSNRTGLVERGNDMLARQTGTESGIGVLFVDLDRFKQVNDEYGHDAGDEVLIVCARRIVGMVRETDTVARVGGDEFIVLAEVTGEDAAQRLADRITETVSEPIRLTDGITVTVGASVGWVWASGQADVRQLIADADARMYAVKRQRNTTDDSPSSDGMSQSVE